MAVDSRMLCKGKKGKYGSLDFFLSSFSELNYPVFCVGRGGARIKDLKDEVLVVLDKHPKTRFLVVLAAGICDFTIKEDKKVSYPCCKLSSALESIHELKEEPVGDGSLSLDSS